MRTTIKAVALLLVTIMMFSIAACTTEKPAASASPTEAPAQSSQGAAPQEAASGAPISIEFWHCLGESQGGPILAELAAEYNANNKLNATVTTKYCADMYLGIARDLQAAAAAGIYPGITMVGWANLNYFAENFPQITSVDEMLQGVASNDAAWVAENFDEPSLELARSINGEVLGLPYCASTLMLYINNDLFRAAGLDPANPPKTLDEVYQAANAVTEKTGEYGIYLGYPLDTHVSDSLMLSAGIEMYQMDANKKATAVFDTPASVDVWTRYQNFYKSGTAVYMGFEEGCSAFNGGKFGMMLNTCARLRQSISTATFELSTTTFPVVSEGHDVCTPLGGNMLCVIAESDEKKAVAWDFLKFLYEPENAAKIVMATGYVPVINNHAERSATLKEYLDSTPLLAPALEDFDKHRTPWVSWPGANGLQVPQVMIDMKDAIIAGTDVATAVADAQNTINGLLG